MYEKLLKTITNLGKSKVLLVGDFMLDSYVYGDALRISPEAPVPVLKVQKTEYGCGGAGSVAADLAELGAVPLCLGIVGNDRNGMILRDMLSQVGAETDGLIEIKDRPTISKQRIVGLAQHRHRQQLMRIDTETTVPLNSEETKQVLLKYEEMLKDADIVCLQDYNKGLLSEKACVQMIKLAKKAGKKVLVDPAPTADYSKYKHATLITPNRKETSAAVGFAIESVEDAAKAAGQLTKKLGLEAAVITLDKEGAYLKTADIDEIIPTKAKSVYDVTGAGDMVLATLAVTLGSGSDYKTAVQLSNFAGGIEVGKFGCATVSVSEIVYEIVEQNRDQSSKVINVDMLINELSWWRSQNKKIVFTNGCFDVVHRGHVEYLKQCKEQGDIVVVGLNSDSSVKAIKGPDRPVNNQHDRAAVLAGLESVDYVVIFEELDPLELIKKVRPDVLVKGQDWENKGVIGTEFVTSYGGRVFLARLVEGKSSTATIEKIKYIKSEKSND